MVIKLILFNLILLVQILFVILIINNLNMLVIHFKRMNNDLDLCNNHLFDDIFTILDCNFYYGIRLIIHGSFKCQSKVYLSCYLILIFIFIIFIIFSLLHRSMTVNLFSIFVFIILMCNIFKNYHKKLPVVKLLVCARIHYSIIIVLMIIFCHITV